MESTVPTYRFHVYDLVIQNSFAKFKKASQPLCNSSNWRSIGFGGGKAAKKINKLKSSFNAILFILWQTKVAPRDKTFVLYICVCVYTHTDIIYTHTYKNQRESNVFYFTTLWSYSKRLNIPDNDPYGFALVLQNSIWHECLQSRSVPLSFFIQKKLYPLIIIDTYWKSIKTIQWMWALVGSG